MAATQLSSKRTSTAINTCAENFFKTMEKSKVFSPLSIGVAMGLVHLGANTKTEAELSKFFGGKLSLDDIVKLHNYFNSSVAKMSNVLFVNKNLAAIKTDYISQIQPVALCQSDDFSNQQAISDIINNFISTNTNGLIKDVVKPAMITPDLAAVLVNTVYFKCMWAKPFVKELTESNVKFTSNLDGAMHLVSMMHNTMELDYYAALNFHMIEIPYQNAEYVMGVVLDKGSHVLKSSHDIWKSALKHLNESIQNMRSTKVQLSLPKFTQRTNIGLVAEFQKHGVKTLFHPKNADLSGIGSKLYISDIIHEAVVIVDEEGTEAAATTAVFMELECCHEPTPPVVFRCDKSFMYYIRHVPSNTLLFLGDYHGN